MAQYSPLPSYTDDDIKAPLISGPTEVNEAQLAPVEESACARRCAGNGFFARMRARCAARHAAKYGPPCENPGCLKKANRRRKFRFFIFGLVSLLFLVHAAKGVYMMYTLPKHVQCTPITDSEISVDLPLTRKMFVDYSLTTATTNIIHSDIPGDSIQVKVAFDNVEDLDDEEKPKAVFCSATLKRAVAVGAYTTKKHAKIPEVVSTTIVLPEGVDGPSIRFGGKKAGHCAGGLIRKLIKWRKEEIMGESD